MFTAKLITYRGEYKVVECNSINIPTPDGRRGILPNHMPIMLPIDLGIMYITENGEKKKYTVTEGIFYFENNEATVLCDAIEDAATIDRERAVLQQQKAEETIRSSDNESDIRRAQLALRKAINRIKAIDND